MKNMALKFKIIIVFLLVLLSLTSFTGYLILNHFIISGSLKVATGQMQIAQGEKRLSSGKARLARGERELEKGKKTYDVGQGALLAASAIFPVALAVTAGGRQMFGSKLAEGDKEIAEGRRKVRAGEQRLAQGREELERGIRQLNRAKWLRNLCGISTAIFAALTLILAYYWRRSLRRV